MYSTDIHRPAAPPHAVRSALVAIPAVCFGLTVLTDLAYARTANLLWLNMSTWLLFAAMIGGGLAALAVVVGVFVHRDQPWRRARWPLVAGGLVVLGVGLLNNLVHARDGWTAVVPFGLALSVATVLLMAAVAVVDQIVLRDRLARYPL